MYIVNSRFISFAVSDVKRGYETIALKHIPTVIFVEITKFECIVEKNEIINSNTTTAKKYGLSALVYIYF